MQVHLSRLRMKAAMKEKLLLAALGAFVLFGVGPAYSQTAEETVSYINKYIKTCKIKYNKNREMELKRRV